MQPDADDFLDYCDLSGLVDDPLPDDWLPWEALFASVRYEGVEAIEERAHEWRELFA
jgi:hypothetical protein